MYQAFSGRLQSASILHSVACRILFALGGHTQRNVKPYGAEVTRREREVRQLRILFWLCYVFDKDMALRSGQPPTMSDDYCDLTLPHNYLDNPFGLPSLGNEIISPLFADERLAPHLPGDLRLSMLKDKACRLLYSAQALKKTDAEVIRDVRELDAELEAWRLAIPPDFRPALSIGENVRLVPEMKLPRSMQRIGLHLEYHHLMTAIHRVSGRCYNVNPETGFDRGEGSGGVNSSIELALEASRSTVFYLKAAIDGLAGEAFWSVSFESEDSLTFSD